MKVANPLVRERCGLCCKYIYTHNIIIVCSLENKPFHAKCLKIDNDTALELQKLPDWVCPHCLKDIIPFFNYDYAEIKEICQVCDKCVSNAKSKVANCSICNSLCHYNCLSNLLCKECALVIDPNMEVELTFDKEHYFDPYAIDDNDDDKDYYFNDDVENYVDTIQIVRKILKDCQYYNVSSLPLSDLKNTTFYFNNIDGFKANFNEFIGNKLNHNTSFDFYCFNETNVKENEPHDFEIVNYNF